jgi:hypothetical protein
VFILRITPPDIMFRDGDIYCKRWRGVQPKLLSPVSRHYNLKRSKLRTRPSRDSIVDSCEADVACMNICQNTPAPLLFRRREIPCKYLHFTRFVPSIREMTVYTVGHPFFQAILFQPNCFCPSAYPILALT